MSNYDEMYNCMDRAVSSITVNGMGKYDVGQDPGGRSLVCGSAMGRQNITQIESKGRNMSGMVCGREGQRGECTVGPPGSEWKR